MVIYHIAQDKLMQKIKQNAKEEKKRQIARMPLSEDGAELQECLWKVFGRDECELKMSEVCLEMPDEKKMDRVIAEASKRLRAERAMQ